MFIYPGLRLPVIDANTDSYFKSAITKAGEAYAVCRILNASVSIIKESHLQIEPAGVGLSLALGQALDPIYDMTERTSDVLITSIVSLGIQKITYELCVAFAPPVAGILLLCILALSFIKNEKTQAFSNLMIRIIIIVIIGRFCLPASSLANQFLLDNFFAPRIAESQKALSINPLAIDKLKDFSLPEIDGVVGTIKNSAKFIKTKTNELSSVFKETINNVEQIVENLLGLAAIYVTIFIVQVILLPILTFWLLIKISNTLFKTSMPYIIRHSEILPHAELSKHKVSNEQESSHYRES